MFSTPFNNAFGIDLSDLSVKIVQLNSHAGRHQAMSFDVKTLRSTKIPHGLIVNGELIEPEKVRQCILQTMEGALKEKKSPLDSVWVVASIPEAQSFLKRITFENSPENITAEEIISTAKTHMPFDENTHFVDWQIIPHDTKEKTVKTHILVGAVSKQIAQSYTFLFESLGLTVVALEPESLAVSRTMITANKTYGNEARAILDLGATHSTLIIYDNNSVQFTISIPFSGELITTAIVQKLGISYSEAEEKKITAGLSYANAKGSLFALLSDMAQQLVEEVKQAINFYESHFEEANQITHITMCGGTANLQQLDEVLTKSLGIESKPGHIFKNLMSKHEFPLDNAKALSYAAAVGLALRAADNPFVKQTII